jgi:Ca2+-binding RTX toxin-like protein
VAVAKRFQTSRDEAFVDDRTNDMQFDPKIAALAGGGFVVTWYSFHLDGVQARRFDANGVAVGASFEVTDLANSNGEFTVTDLESGGFAVSWIDTVAGSSKLSFRLYDSAGAALGPATVLAGQSIGSGTIPSIVGLESGGFVIVFDRSGTGGIGGRLFDASGQPIGGELALDNGIGGLRLSPNVVALPSGGFAATWELYKGASDRDVHYRVFDSSGAPLGPEVEVATGIANQAAPRLTVLASGGTLLTWEELGATDWDVRAQLFDAAGAKVGSPFLVNTVTAADQRSPTVAGLGDGFVVAWSDSSGTSLDSYGTAIKAQAFDAAGAKVGGEYVVNSHKVGSQTVPAVAQLADGSIAAVWFSTDNVFPGPFYALRAKVVDLLSVTETNGTGNADVLAGGAGPDDISGLGGDDIITGGEGDDVILGGDGVDDLAGGEGDDRLDGGIGGDRLDGGKGDDLLFGGEGNDTLVYFGPDVPHGIDRLDGGAGNDLFDVFMTWATGSNAVTLIGGDGDDRFVIDWRTGGPSHYSTAITIDAGPGADRIEIKALDGRGVISLGGGADTIVVDPYAGASFIDLDSDSGGIYISDFTAGPGGDRLQIQSFLEQYLIHDWDGATNPFVHGHIKLEQRGADAVLLVRPLLIYDFQTMIVFRNLDASTLTAFNLGGIAPDGSPFPATSTVGTADGERIDGTFGPDTIDGAGGNDILLGSAGHDILNGGSGIDSMGGGFGNDVMDGGADTDYLQGGPGDDVLRGGEGFYYDSLDGGYGDDRLDGGAGADILNGGPGSDTFIVDNAGDAIEEYDYFTGTDRALSSVSILLADEVEELELTGSAPLSGTGNVLSNLILGNAGANSLDGGDGDDVLDGRGGADMTIGGAGADTHRIGDSGDVASEQASGGIDRVETALGAYTLSANLENIVGMGSAQSLTGNAIANHISGTALNDVLAGEDGNDVLWGGLGADSLSGGAGRDLLIGGVVGGTDLIVNGSFEQAGQYEMSRQYILAQPTDDGTSLSRTLASLPGWSSAGGLPLELHTARAPANAFNPAHGTSLLDLETAAGQNQAVFQDVGGVAAGTRLLLTFAAALPAAGGTAVLDVYWNGIKVSTVVPASTEMTQHAVFVTAAAGLNRLEFREAGSAGDGHGTALDMVSLRTVAASPDISANDLNGGAGSDLLLGDNGNDLLRLYEGGDDAALAGAGNDSIFAGAALTAADVVDGGAGVDTLVLQGAYASLTLSANVTGIENVSILGGNNSNFGEPGTNRYDYVLTTSDVNFAAGVQARINGSALLEGEDFTFNGSAETNASFVVYGGKGVDSLTGGLGNDIFFYAEERFASGDTVNGGAGYDGMFLRGNYTIDFNAPGYTGLFTNIENLTLTSATDERYARGGGSEFDYNLVLSNAIVNAGQTLTISGALLMASETMVLDGSQETDGFLRLFGGAAADTLKGGALADLIHGAMGADTLRGGGGADVFRYQAVTESYSVARDHIVDFTPGTDRIDLSAIDASRSIGGDQAFAWIGSSAFTNVAGQLRAFQSGAQWIVQGDINGDGFADLVIALSLQGPTPLGAGDFLL